MIDAVSKVLSGQELSNRLPVVQLQAVVVTGMKWFSEQPGRGK